MRVSYLQSLGITYSNDGANYAMWLELPYSQPSRDLNSRRRSTGRRG